MAKITYLQEILEDIHALKAKLVKAQDYEGAAVLRELEKRYLDMEVSFPLPNDTVKNFSTEARKNLIKDKPLVEVKKIEDERRSCYVNTDGMETCNWCNGSGVEISGGITSRDDGSCPHCEGRGIIMHENNLVINTSRGQ